MLSINAGIALWLGLFMTIAKLAGFLKSVSWFVVTWPVWGTILLIFAFGFAERYRPEHDDDLSGPVQPS